MKRARYKFVYNYNRTGKLNCSGEAVVYVRVSFYGTKFFSTGVYLKPNQWNDKKQMVIKHVNKDTLNNLLLTKKGKIQQYELELAGAGKLTNVHQLDGYKEKRAFNQSFYDFYEKELELEKHKPSYRNQRTTLTKHLKGFRKKVSFGDINISFVRKFDAHLRQNCDSLQSENTFGRQHKNLRKFINRAIEQGKILKENNPYGKGRFPIPKADTEPNFLTTKELLEFEKLPVSMQMERVKDLFLFCCYTGLRFSDAHKLTYENFTQTKDGLMLRFTAQKTKKPHNINLSLLPKDENGESKAEQLVLQYLDGLKLFLTRSDMQHRRHEPFFKISEQRYNTNLKKLFADIECSDKLKNTVSSHAGRHTFGTQMIIRGIPPMVLKDLMQHSDIRETMLYVHLTGKNVEDALKKQFGVADRYKKE